MLKKNKIAFVLTPIDFGGAEKVCLNFLKNFRSVNFEIYPILLIRPWEDDNFFLNEIRNLDYSIFTIPVALNRALKENSFFRVLRCFKQLFAYLKQEKIDIIHTNGYFADIIGIPVAKILKIPHIAICHGYVSTDINLSFYNFLDRLFLRFSNKIIAVSDTIANQLFRSGIKKERIRVIQNAVEIKNDLKTTFKFRRDTKLSYGIDKEIVIGYIGRLSEEKGIKYLIQAIFKLKTSGINIKLFVIGDGPQKKEIHEIVKAQNILDEVVFTGFQSNIEQWLSVLDIFILPSLTEGTPMALLEAMAKGIPVVASAVGGVPNVIKTNQNGILVPAGSSDDLYNAVLTIIDDDSLKETLSKNAKKTIEFEFNFQRWITEIELVYEEFVKYQDKG